MPRISLKYAADTLCHLFCGWRQMSSKNRLVELGSGTLEIDILASECFFDGKHIPRLSIATELLLFLENSLGATLFRALVLRARLRVKLSFSRTTWYERRNKEKMFYVRGQPIRATEMHRCKFECDSEIVKGSRTYRANYKEIEEWPIGWPSD
jgi:hypothetical protein